MKDNSASTSAVCWIVALHQEAAPLIAQWKLKRTHMDCPFDIFQSQDGRCRLLICGMGKVAAASATAFAYGLWQQENTVFSWLNFGAAGHRSEELGTMFLGHKIIDSSNDRAWYPTPHTNHALPSQMIQTLDLPTQHYPATALIDMEAAGFLATASRFASLERIAVIKIVSDNATTPLSKPSKPQWQQWVHTQIHHLEQIHAHLLEQAECVAKRLAAPRDWSVLVKSTHFSQTQKHRLRRLLHQYELLKPPTTLERQTLLTLKGKTSREILDFLQRALTYEQRQLLTETEAI